MTDSPFRHSDLEIVVDIAQSARFDRKSFQISDMKWNKIGNNLKQVPVSDRDRVKGNVRVRELEQYDVIFIVTRDEAQLVVTIINVRLPNTNETTEQLIEKIAKVGKIRGGLGI